MNIIKKIARWFGLVALSGIIVFSIVFLWAMPTREEQMCDMLLTDGYKLLHITDELYKTNDPLAIDAHMKSHETLMNVYVACPIQYALEAREGLSYLEGHGQAVPAR